MTSTSQHSRRGRPPRSLKTTLILAAVVVGYALLQPRLESWFGDGAPSGDEEQIAPFEPSPVEPDGQSPANHRGEATEPTTFAPPADPGSRSESAHAGNDPPVGVASETAATTHAATPKLGELRDIGGGAFQSAAGLTYRRGSQEGHRVNHILRHHEDDPDRPVHGVFDGDRNEVFAVIDEAYLYTFDHGPPRVTTEKDDGRTIYRVDLGRRIGYVGGQSGRRQGHPPAEHVQLILDGTNVITAYPVRVRQRRD